MMNKVLVVLLALLSCVSRTVAQEVSVVVNEDKTVSLSYYGKARRVRVQSDFYYDRDSTRYSDRTHRLKMKRDSDGVFRVTTPPIAPECYTYCFRVNGKRVPDPLNSDTAWQMLHKWNIVTVGGTPQADLYLKPKRHGRVVSSSWRSPGEGLSRRVRVYLPAGYEDSATHKQDPVYPVLYLIHGINGYEGSWSERGRAIEIMENLAAQGRCKPMIIVMPDVNVGVHEDRPSHHTLWNNIVNYPRLCRHHEIEKGIAELVKMIDSCYHVSGERYIAGFSDGARIAANTAILLPGYFSAVGLFSPVVHKEQTALGELEEVPAISIYTGKKDMFYGNAKRFDKRLNKQQTAHRYVVTTGGHTWRNWRIYLSEFLCSLTTP